MVIVAILIGVLLCVCFIVALSLSENESCDYNVGVFVGIIITVLAVIEISIISETIGNPTPSALDVYRGNTELEITSVNGIPTDTVVVFKKN